MGNRRVSKAVLQTLFGISAILLTTFVLGRYSLQTEQSQPASPSKSEGPTLSSGSSLLTLPPQILTQRILEPAQTLRLTDREALYRNGWKFVEVPSALPSIIDLDPQALGAHEGEIQVQIQTGTHVGRALERLKEIALRTENLKTRAIAIEGLGNSPDPQAQKVLIELFNQIQSESIRSKIVTYISPSQSGDPSWNFLYELIGNPNASLKLKEQATFGLLQLNESSDPKFLDQIPQSWKVRFTQLQERSHSQHRHPSSMHLEGESP